MKQEVRNIRDEAIQREIVEVIEAAGKNVEEYDVEAIAGTIIEVYEDDYGINVDGNGFWRVVAENKI